VSGDGGDGKQSEVKIKWRSMTTDPISCSRSSHTFKVAFYIAQFDELLPLAVNVEMERLIGRSLLRAQHNEFRQIMCGAAEKLFVCPTT